VDGEPKRPQVQSVETAGNVRPGMIRLLLFSLCIAYARKNLLYAFGSQSPKIGRSAMGAARGFQGAWIALRKSPGKKEKRRDQCHQVAQ
jgi:hypothetical protein